MAKSIETHGQFRTYLTNMMVGVGNGDVKPEQARVVMKFAEKVTENVYAETKVMLVMHQLGRAVPELGELKIDPAK